MSDHSSIEWTDATWNPVTGCTEVSPGCAHCYAKRFAERFRGVPGHPFEHGFDLQLRPERLDEPLHWRKPRRVFVCSMADLFHEQVPFTVPNDPAGGQSPLIDYIFGTMAETPRHTYQVLTKRPDRMRDYLLDEARPHRVGMAMVRSFGGGGRWEYTHPGRVKPLEWPLPNVWLGTSIENDRFVGRADYLRQTPAAVRFISAEPLLGPLPSLDLTGIDWLIVGGESGPGARAMDPDWARDLRDRCKAAGVAFFMKQMGGLHHGGPIPADLDIKEYPR